MTANDGPVLGKCDFSSSYRFSLLDSLPFPVSWDLIQVGVISFDDQACYLHDAILSYFCLLAHRTDHG